MPVKKELGGEAMWLAILRGRVGAFIGRLVTAVKTVEREEGGLRVCGVTLSDVGVPFDFSVCGPFDVEVVDPAALPVPSAEMLHPFGTEFSPAVPAGDELTDVAQLWAWSSAQVPVFAQPRLPGFTSILEKKGGKAQLWFDGARGIDQLSKFVTLKEFVLTLPHDFVAEASVGVERDGARLAQPDQMMILEAPNPTLGPTDRLSIELTDLLFVDGNDLHGQDAAMRYQALDKLYREALLNEPSFRVTPQQEARDLSQLQSSVGWARAFPGSLGAVVKAASAPYVLTGPDDKRARVGAKDVMALGIYKALPAQRIAIGVVLRPNRVDAQEDIMTPEDVQKAAHWYMENGQVIKLRHGKDPIQKDAPLKAVVLESYIAPVDFMLGEGQVKAGDWVAAVRFDDQGIWDKIESGEYQAFSVGGVGTRQEV